MKALYEFCGAYGYTVEWIGLERQGCLPVACRLLRKQPGSAEARTDAPSAPPAHDDDGAPHTKRQRTE